MPKPAMDVTCTRCGTDYEFEETLISTRGTTVKCTKCGHLFKVFRPEEEGVENASAAPRTHWTLRHADGSTEKLASLAELTKRIGDGQLSEDDQISRSGQAWKRLGEIDELRGFFVQGRSGRPPPPRARSATPALGLNPPRPDHAQARSQSSSPPSLPIGVGSARPPRMPGPDAAPVLGSRPAPPLPRFESMGASVSIDSAPPQTGLAPGAASARPPAPSASLAPGATSARPPPPPASMAPAATSARPLPPAAPQAESASGVRSEPSAVTADAAGEAPAAPETADPDASITARRQPSTATAEPVADEIVPTRRSRGSLWFVLALLLAGGAASAWLTVQRPTPTTPAQDSITLQLDEADAALASHRRARFNDGVVAYGKALAAYPIDPHVLSSISRTYAVWAQEVRFELEDLEQRASPPPLDHRERLRAELQRLTSQARDFAERAARKNPGNEEAEVALADALRLAGNLVAARSELDRARATEPTPEAETLRVAALLAIAEAQGNQTAGRALAEQAVQRDPDLIRTRELLLRILAALDDLTGARRELDAVRTLDPEHPLLPALAALVARAEARIAAEAERKRAVEAEALAALASSEELESETEPSGYRELVKRGELQLERGAVAQAKLTFGKALALQPKGAEAKTGLGYVALENGNPELAIRLFRGPAGDAHPDALIGLGDAYRRLGRLRDALQQYRAYQRRYPNGQRASIARRQIELLQEQVNEK
jgi:predicted Zn finger-like uncharacterized protein